MQEASLTIRAHDVGSRTNSGTDTTFVAETSEELHRLDTLVRLRFKVSMTYAAVMVALLFGFILLVAYDKPLLATLVAPGLTLALLAGAAVVIGVVALTAGYAIWSARYEQKIRELAERGGIQI